MQFIMDMVHDNPGEERFSTKFRNPETLVEYGYNAQVFKHANTIADFSEIKEDFFSSDEAKVWLDKMTEIVSTEFSNAKKAGLMTMSHIDLFVLPKLLVEKYRNDICDSDGKISIFKDKTKEIHRVLFDEIFRKHPIDGLIIRVGETYLHDTPYHTGNGAVRYGDIKEEKDTFVELINFLVEEVCKKHNKYLIFRTWDCFPDRFHSDLKYYLDITDRITPCEKLIFSIKHTSLDFWRRVRFNPCLGQGKHRQVVEVQCQREYEGKGAYPMYVMNGIINGFSENKEKKGLKDIIDNPLICGIYSWSRGGGWFGPYIKNEFWCELNTYIISHYAQNPSRSEKDIFMEFANNVMGLDEANAYKFYKLCLKVPEAVLCGQYIEEYDKRLKEEIMPSELWMRDDQLGGLRQLGSVFNYLEQRNLVKDVLKEKENSVLIWEEIKAMFEDIEIPDNTLREFIGNSIEYGLRLFTIVNISFRIFANCRKHLPCDELLKEYDLAWKHYRDLEKLPQASSSYKETYYFAEGHWGLDETIDFCRKYLSKV